MQPFDEENFPFYFVYNIKVQWYFVQEIGANFTVRLWCIVTSK